MSSAITEFYVNVPGFVNYRVSASGDVESNWRGGWKVLKACPDPKGRLRVNLIRDKRYTVRVYRIVLEAFIGPCPEGMEACHKDGDSNNNILSNLRWDTRKNNHLDKVKHGTDPRGERNPNAKLSDEDVVDIRAKRASGVPRKVVAKEYGIDEHHVKQISGRKCWKHIK